MTRIRAMISELAPDLLQTEDVEFEEANIADFSVDEIQSRINAAAMVVFSGGPQNVVDTDQLHEEAIRKLDSLTAETLISLNTQQNRTRYMLSICLGHQSLGKVLGMKVRQNPGGQFLDTDALINIDFPNGEKSQIIGKAYHRYHVEFKETQRNDGLHAVEFARLAPEAHSSTPDLNYGMRVFDAYGDVRVVGTQFHPEASFDSNVPETNRKNMTNTLTEAFAVQPITRQQVQAA